MLHTLMYHKLAYYKLVSAHTHMNILHTPYIFVIIEEESAENVDC